MFCKHLDIAYNTYYSLEFSMWPQAIIQMHNTHMHMHNTVSQCGACSGSPHLKQVQVSIPFMVALQ